MEPDALPPEDRPQRRLPPKDFQPRSYQVKVFEVAAQRNTIAVLETGAGKTMIAVMLIKELKRRFLENGEKKLIVFLAPTVGLVNQQVVLIRQHVEFEVAEFYGTKGVDGWSDKCWRAEFETKDIMMDISLSVQVDPLSGFGVYSPDFGLSAPSDVRSKPFSYFGKEANKDQSFKTLSVVVMTPQILLNALRHAFLSLDKIGLIIFDECHRANGNHPYTRIMKEFYHSSICKPAIFGMTASPIAGKGLSTGSQCEEKISKLERILDSKVFTVEDRAELEAYAPSAKLTNCYYDSNKHKFEDLRFTLQLSIEKIDRSLEVLHESQSNTYKDTTDMIKAARKSLSSCHQMITYCLNDLGLICAAEAAKICLESIHCNAEESEISKAASQLLISLLKEVLILIEHILPHEYDELIKTECGYKEAAKLGFISPKLVKLVNICWSFIWEEVYCLVFVEKRITAKVLKRFMTMISNTSLISASYLTGGSSSKDSLSSKEQRTTLDLFRAGEVNLLFSTDVAEEGIHVTNCSCVIRFDLPKTVCSYIQSRGRARRNDSSYILMIERDNTKHRDQLFSIIRSEFLIQNSAMPIDSKLAISNVYRQENPSYQVKSTGAAVSAESSIYIIYKYCESLPKDRYYTPKPIFQITDRDGLYECTLVLPPNAAYQSVKGPLCSNPNLAKQIVSLEACKKLHILGALDDHLLPSRGEPLEVNIFANKGYTSGAGTTKSKELHGMKIIHALSGTWACKRDNAALNAYMINFTCNQDGESYSPFVLLIEKVLDDDVASAEVELFLIPNKLVNAYVSPLGSIHLSREQIEKAKLFQEFFFNGIFGSLFAGSGSSEGRPFLLDKGQRLPWSSSNMYLLLPLVCSPTSHKTLSIDWKGINECASAIEYLRRVYSIDGEYNSGSLSAVCSCQSKCQNPGIVHFANKSLEIENLKDLVVYSVHNRRIYTVLNVINDVTSWSPFEESEFDSFMNYYKNKYGIVLHHPGQPLLLLKQSHNPHNLLLSKSRFQDSSTGELIMLEKEQVHAHLPPELLVHVDISVDTLKSFYLLPSVMQRLESLMLASQLREEIGYSYNHTRISSSLILEAITTLRCCETFSMERLELLGDSVLKYSVGCHLFLNYPNKHEGQLSDHRTWTVSNSALHRLGISRSLQGYIRDNAFDPRRWVAPGQISLRPCPCICGIDTSDVPTESKYTTEEPTVAVGKPCDNGHRWMCSKTIADCVEALVGAYYLGGGLNAAFSIMRWFGFDINLEIKLAEEAKLWASKLYYHPKENLIEKLEMKLNYKFTVKGLLLEAITHPSLQELGLQYCYQRLEFLGDSVLDLLITRYLFLTHKDIGPGELTDLRSASVNNANFALAAVRNKLEQFLQHSSGILSDQVTEYIRYISNREDMLLPVGTNRGPKVLGDIIESITGAVLVDTCLDLDKVWEVFKPILSPIITPDKLELPPLRELIELCSYLGYFIKDKCTKMNDQVVVEITIQLGNELLIGHGNDKNKKIAKAQAAVSLLRDLKERGISHAQCVSRRTQDKTACSRNSLGFVADLALSESSTFSKDIYCEEYCNQKSFEHANPVVIPITMDKGGPRNALFNLCRTLQWPMPKFEFTEEKFRNQVIINGVTTKSFNVFIANIMLHIPNERDVRLTGEQKTDKKSAQDSASYQMLLELERRGLCTIKQL